ncbi:MAG: single-stranded DNA-binding protein [Microbacteriaceae bacterium]|nr:single-stranded DNA-binding protein [Microbacteriaceae bacterium]
MSLTTMTVVGTVATDLKLIRTASDVNLCSFRLAHDERRFDRQKQAWVESNTNWFRVTLFRSLAEHAHESFQKGDRVIVKGRLRVREWENGEKRGTSVEIEADAIGHDVRWGVTQFEKRTRATHDRQQSHEHHDEAFVPVADTVDSPFRAASRRQEITSTEVESEQAAA